MSAAAPEGANEGCVGPTSDNAGKESSCAGCPNQAACASGAARAPDPAQIHISDRMALVKHKVLVLSGKGGVGKSTCAAQLAFALAKQGKQVGLLDIDICGPSIPRMLGLVGQDIHQSASGWSPVYVDDNLGVMSIAFMISTPDEAVIWRGPRKNNIIRQFLQETDWGALDYLIIDTPPGTSDEHISIVQYLKPTNVDGAVIVTTPQEVSMADVRKEINFCKKTGLNILGVVENMGHISISMGDLDKKSGSGISIIDGRGIDVTESIMLRLKQSCPDITSLYIKAPIFTPTEGAKSNPQKMARDFGIPYLGSIPMDPKMLACCEKGFSFLEAFPTSPAAAAFSSIVGQIVSACDAALAGASPPIPGPMDVAV